ncbi:hypothetical protein LZ554_008529 [Drepanopeziza brunnea f. sp. 'monogermtubi']|nr:hypothetical protein LZ554_008529 [Drepanopeziza brunnea f. sp. 'monogermtubi']
MTLSSLLFSLLANTLLVPLVIAAPAAPAAPARPSAAAAACFPPNVKVTIDKSSFQVPIFKDCNFGSPAATIPSSTAPATAVSASADYSKYVDSKGAALSSDSMKQLLAHFGQAVGLDVLLGQTICTVTDAKSGIFTIDSTLGPLNGGAAVNVGSYRCIIDL